MDSPPRNARTGSERVGISALGSAIQRQPHGFPAGTVATKDSPGPTADVALNRGSSGGPRGCHRPNPLPSLGCSNGPSLPAGPRVISARLPTARSVSIAAYVLAGSRLETAGQVGVAHFMEHLTFKGTDRLPVDARDQRGDRGRRRLVQRGHRSRIDRLLGARPAPRGGPRDGRHRRADRPAAPRGRRYPERTDRDHRGDPLVPRRSVRVLPDPVPDRDVRRRAAGARDLRRGIRHPGASRGSRSATSGGPPTGRPTRSSRSSATCHTTRRSASPGRRSERATAWSRVSHRLRSCRPDRACAPASATRARRSSASACRPSIGTTRTAGRWRSSTPSSATA